MGFRGLSLDIPRGGHCQPKTYKNRQVHVHTYKDSMIKQLQNGTTTQPWGGGVTQVKTYVNMCVWKVFKWTHISEVDD